MAFINAEITDMIIDFLHDRPDALKVCSLVCRSWLPASRFHLFRSLTLRSHAPLRYSRNENPHPCNELLAIIQRNPNIALLIHDLHIREGQEFRKENWINQALGLPLLLKSLPKLTALHLRRVEWTCITPELRDAFRRVFSFPSLTNIDLELCYFPFTSFVRLISTCQNLKSLNLRGTMIQNIPAIGATIYATIQREEAGYPEQVTGRDKCQLDDLRITDCSSEVISWIADPNGILDLSCLRILHCHAWSSTITALLLELEKSVQHLTLSAPWWLPCTSIFISLSYGPHSNNYDQIRS
jgi:hypothetical protein